MILFFRGSLADRGTEYCSKAETHDYQLCLAINDIEHTRTKAKSPQTTGICERFHKTMLQEFYQLTFRKKIYQDMKRFNLILTFGLKNITMNAPIKEKCVVLEPRWKCWKMASKFGKRKK